VVKHVDAAEVRIVIAKVLAAAADAALVANHLLKLGAHLVTVRPVEELAWKHAGEGRGGGRGGGRDAAAAGDKKTRQL
jgi:hypothetical protein